MQFLISVVLLSCTVAAQSCQQDVLVDDFRARNASMFRQQPLTLIEDGKVVSTGCDTNTGFNGCNKTLNLMGGDFGDSGAAEVLSVGSLDITAGNNSAVVGSFEADARPNTAVTINYWFTKFNWENDFDLTPYSGMSLDFIAPIGSDFNITLTQWIPSVNKRGIDSQYRVLSSYVVPNGKPQTLNLKWTDFGTNLNGQPFDLKHLKDVTFVNFVPVGAVFKFTKMTLTGTCGGNGGAAPKTTGAVVAATTSKSSAAVVGVWGSLVGAVLLLAL
ncbi:hypothetical protein BDR26DRAFT_865878 [Obelidium mucronatum]|nr:hypothetical protein BDR26DRAFT_865878 [Obelidium mucronatum]